MSKALLLSWGERGREGLREKLRDRDQEPDSLFPSGFTPYLNSNEGANLLKYLSVETGSGQETKQHLAFFSSHVPSGADSSFVTRACLTLPCSPAVFLLLSLPCRESSLTFIIIVTTLLTQN